MTRTSTILGLTITCGLALPALGQQTNLTGTIAWTDSQSQVQVARKVRVEVWDNKAGVKLATTYADTSGNYAANVPAGKDLYIKAFTDQQQAGYVARDNAIAAGSAYQIASGVTVGAPAGAATINVTAPNNSDAGRAFSIADAMRSAYVAATTMRGAPAPVGTGFPHTSSTASNWDGTNLHILQLDRWDWDVIHHEYGHYVSSLDKTTSGVGGKHTFGVNLITGSGDNSMKWGKDHGTKLAWGEGLATYMGLAFQQISWEPPNLRNAGDLIWHDTEDASWAVNIENIAGVADNAGKQIAGRGEADELSVMRILWDLADGIGANGTSEAHDKVSLGYKGLYTILDDKIAKNTAGNLVRLGDVWNHLDANAPKDAVRKDYGAIFEQYGASPKPGGAVPGAKFQLTDAAPIFEWDAGNDGHNDTFDLIVFNKDFTERLVDAQGLTDGVDLVRVDDTFYLDPSSPIWDHLTSIAQAEGPTTFKFVVAGSDLVEDDGAIGSFVATGGYWSGAYGFTIIPAPGATALLALAGLIATPRSRRERAA